MSATPTYSAEPSSPLISKVQFKLGLVVLLWDISSLARVGLLAPRSRSFTGRRPV